MRRNPLVRLLPCAALSVMAAGTAMISTTPARASTPSPCAGGQSVAIRSTQNNQYVSAELGYTGTNPPNYGMLRARSGSIGPWEKFWKCPTKGTGTDPWYSLQSQANDLYVTAEFGYPGSNYGMLRARSSSVGAWETFVSCNNCIQSDYNGNYAAAEVGYTGSNYGMLRARSSSVGAWESYTWVYNP